MKYYILSFLIIVIYVLIKYYVIEGFTGENLSADNASQNLADITGESLCSIYSSKPQELNNKCGLLTEKNCNSTSCCVWLNGEKCVSGNVHGPTFRTTGGKTIDIKYYSYQNNLVGNKS